MSVNASPQDWSEPEVRRVRLTHRNMHFVLPPKPLSLNASIIVGVTHRNEPRGLLRALKSAVSQDIAKQCAFVVLDDSSDEGWIDELDAELLSDPRLVIAAGRFGSPPQARNGLLDLIDQFFPSAIWVARMDADDCFAEPGSLSTLVRAGNANDSQFVIGSNLLSIEGRTLPSANWACPETLLDRTRLNAFIQGFCRGNAPNELPSCNLLLRARSGIRYPNATSAEDHWLVAGLLMHRPQDGCVVPAPPYAVYSLGGDATKANQRSNAWKLSRMSLAEAATAWHQAHLISGGRVLGWGQEGVVWQDSSGIFKRMYPSVLSTCDLEQTKRLADLAGDAIIAFDVISNEEGRQIIRLAEAPLQVVPRKWPLDLSRHLLTKLYGAGVVTSNIKRENLRLTASGELQYIDIGRDIASLTASRFLDCAARLFAIGELGWSDHELARRKTTERQLEAFAPLTGFDAFYGDLIRSLHSDCLIDRFRGQPDNATPSHTDVTLLVKCCPQDADSLALQIGHLVSELGARSRFAKKVLLIDPFEGPYLRQYAAGDLPQLLGVAEQLTDEGLIDEVWVAPTSGAEVAEVNARWFAAEEIFATHTDGGAPLVTQVWAFERVETPFVLQLDVDVLIGGTDLRHDVIGDMKRACIEEDVWCVGFNIPKSQGGFRPYEGAPAHFAPEVRCGLLNLDRIKRLRPFSNPVSRGRLTLMWHRALQLAQPVVGMRSVRGGDSRTFYVHPRNEDKLSPSVEWARDQISQGRVPRSQLDKWDLVSSSDWRPAPRREEIIFLLFGRETPPDKLERCLSSLRRQSSQDFGVILIDDAGCPVQAASLPHRLGSLAARTTLIRRARRVGYLENFREAVKQICVNPDAMLVVLDQDDALMRDDVILRVHKAWSAGADLINAPMFRPDKPLAVYEISYDAPRQRGGGNVWSHLRAFRKSLFERVPDDVWNCAPDHYCLSDFLTMVPMAELAQMPVTLDGPYLYWHDRAPYSSERKKRELVVKTWLFSQAPLSA